MAPMDLHRFDLNLLVTLDALFKLAPILGLNDLARLLAPYAAVNRAHR